jgi:hypothetical protein
MPWILYTTTGKILNVRLQYNMLVSVAPNNVQHPALPVVKPF